MVADQNRTMADVVLLGNLFHDILLEEWTAGGAQRTVSFDQDAFLFAEVGDVLLRKQRMVLDLTIISEATLARSGGAIPGLQQERRRPRQGALSDT